MFILTVLYDFFHQANAGASSVNSWWSLGSSVVTNIIENIQLRVHDVHLRYEDDVTIPGVTFACGILIKSLSAQSTDGSWVRLIYIFTINADVLCRNLYNCIS